jgi:hypothetical protein
MSINSSGEIAGWLNNSRGVFGFVRAADGIIAEFDVEGLHQTFAVAINDGGIIAGYTNNAAFIRAFDGTVNLFKSPSGGPIQALSINGAAAAAGYWVDAQKITHGFVRSSDGSFTSFDAPNQGGGLNPGTYALSINEGP